jgi:N4-gp56 family major capsid protein
MATTSYPVNHPLAVKLWSKKLFHDVIGESFFGRFMGEGSDSMIQLKTETSKGAGDTVYQGLRVLLSGDGIQGDATLEGNEEALSTYRDAVVINQLRHAVRSDGKMSEQRVPFSVREEARMGLKDWWTERLETVLANQLTGNTDETDTKYTGNNATVAPTASSRIICGGGHAGETSLSATTTHAIRLSDLDKAVTIAKTATATRQRIRPVNVDGKRYYVVFLHPYQIQQLRADASTAGNFFDVNQAILQGGKISDNPIITRASFIYGQTIVHEWSYLPDIVGAPNSGSRADFRRGVLCGAQAAMLAVGQGSSPNKMSWDEELFDYKNQLGVAAGMIMGLKKTVFNSVDFGTIVLSGYAPAP